MTIDLDALEALEKKATQGEWTTQRFPNGCHFDRILRDGYTVDGVTYVPDYEHPMLCKDDAALIAAARNALPELIRLARIGQRVERDASPGPSQECVSDLSERLRQYADIADAGGKAHWANAMREAMYTLAVYRQNAAKEEHDAHR